jgi:hypothetical protein
VIGFVISYMIWLLYANRAYQIAPSYGNFHRENEDESELLVFI